METANRLTRDELLKAFAYIPYDPEKETPEQAMQRARVMDDSGRIYDSPFHWGVVQKETASLRDQFAMAALTGLVAGVVEPKRYKKDHAMAAYALADAMIEARK